MKVKSLSRVRLFATTWSAAYQVPASMGFSRREYWSGMPLPSLSGDIRYMYWDTKGCFLLGTEALKIGHSFQLPSCY